MKPTAYTYTHDYYLEHGDLPATDVVQRACECTLDTALTARRRVRKLYDIGKQHAAWEAAARWAADLERRRAAGARTDVRPYTVASSLTISKPLAVDAVRIVAKLEALQRAVKQQRQSA